MWLCQCFGMTIAIDCGFIQILDNVGVYVWYLYIIFFLFPNLKICCGHLKESSRRDGF